MDFTIAISTNDNGLDSQENKPVKRSDFQTKTANFLDRNMDFQN